MTSNSTAEWIAGQVTEAFPWDTAPSHLIRDRDSAFGVAYTRRVRAMGIRDHPVAARSPWQNGYVERLIGSIRRECVDHVVVFGESHLRRILETYAACYNEVRAHLSLDKEAPNSRRSQRFGTSSRYRFSVGSTINTSGFRYLTMDTITQYPCERTRSRIANNSASPSTLRARCCITPAATGAAVQLGWESTLLWLDFADLGRLHEGDGGAAHPQKTVKGLLHTVHLVERDQFHPDHLAVELDLFLYVLGADRDVVKSVGQAYFNALLQLKRKRANSASFLSGHRPHRPVPAAKGTKMCRVIQDFRYRTAGGTIVNSFRTSFTPLVCCATCCAVAEMSVDGTVPCSVTTPATVSTWISAPFVTLFSCKTLLTFAVIAVSDTAVTVP